MSSVVTGVLSSTVCLLWNKASDGTTVKLKDAYITDAQIRETVAQELTKIQTKLDGLSRKDLHSSYSSLREGVDLMNVCLDKSVDEQEPVLNETPDDGGETSRISSGVIESGFFNKALELSHTMGKLKLNSHKEWESAKERFTHASKMATQAFSTENVSIKDKIFAAKLRIVSEIMERLESPETATTECLSFLVKLHSLPAIQEIVSVYLNGGIKSILNKAGRVENVKSLMLINCVLFQFVSKFSNKYCSAHGWPTVELANRSFSPILNWQEVSTRRSMTLGEELTQPPNEMIPDEELVSLYSAVNSHGQILVGHRDDIKLISRTGKSKVVKLPALRDSEVIVQYIEGVAVDEKDNVYVVKELKVRSDVIRYVLYVLNENYNVVHECTLKFLEARKSVPVRFAVNKNNNIILIKQNDRRVYVCDITGNLKYTFERDSRCHRHLYISEKNEFIISLSHDRKAVQSFTEEGDLESTIEVPNDHVVISVAFHYVIGKIIVLTFIKKKDAYFLLCLSEKGDLEKSTFFCKRITQEFGQNITSHPSGPVAVVSRRRITFI